MGKVIIKTITQNGCVYLDSHAMSLRGMWIKFDLLFARKLGKRSELSQVAFVSSKHYPPRFVTVQCKYEQIEICDDFQANQMTIFERL